MFKKILPLALWLIAVATTLGQNAVMVNRSNSIITYPLNFWTANALAGRSGLGFSTNLSPLWVATNVATARTAIGALATNGDAINLTNFPTILLRTNGNGAGLTNLTAANITGTVALASNVTGTIAISNGGSGATTAGGAKTNLGIGNIASNSINTSSNAASGGSINLSGGTDEGATGGNISLIGYNASAGSINLSASASGSGQGGSITSIGHTAAGGSPGGSINMNGGTEGGGGSINTSDDGGSINTTDAFIELGRSDIRTTLTGTATSVITVSLPQSSVTLVGYSTNGTLTAQSRTNLGLGWTGTNAATSRTNLGLGTTNAVVFSNLSVSNGAATNLAIALGSTNRGFYATAGPERIVTVVGGIDALQVFSNSVETATGISFSVSGTGSFGTNVQIGGPLSFSGSNAVGSAAATRTNLGLGTAATNPATAFQPSSSVLTNLASSNGSALTNLTAANITGTVGLASNVTGTIAISNGGSGATTAGGARTNIGLGNISTNTIFSTQTAVFVNTNFVSTNGAAIFTNIQTGYLEFGDYLFVGDTTNTNIIVFENPANRTNFLRGLGLGPTNNVAFASVTTGDTIIADALISWNGEKIQLEENTLFGGWTVGEALAVGGPIDVLGQTNKATTRTNLGLGWSALTNTNTAGFNTSLYGSGTNPVLYNTNGQVVSPTNFWQVAPISTTVQYQTNVTGTSTNAATNSRNLFLFSLAPSVSGVTNTVTLPTNPATTLEGDRATIIHLGTNSASTVTAVRQLGATNSLITLNQGDEAVLFMYRSGAWTLADNISYVEPIFFSGTNAASHVAASRTNLGIPLAALTNTNAAGFQRAIFSTNSTPTNSANVNSIGFNTAVAWMEVSVITNGATNSYRIPLFQ
jgi:hypothetical protein